MILTKDYIKMMTQKYNMGNRKNQLFVEFYNESLCIQKEQYDIFLVPDMMPKDQLYGLLWMFNQAGYAVSLDWKKLDGETRLKLTEGAAQIQKMRMNRCKTLIYMTDKELVETKWCPWELGYFDGHSDGKCCIFPILDEEEKIFQGQEYFGLYPYLEYDMHYQDGNWDFWVCKTSGEAVVLSEWLGNQQVLWGSGMIKL